MSSYTLANVNFNSMVFYSLFKDNFSFKKDVYYIRHVIHSVYIIRDFFVNSFFAFFQHLLVVKNVHFK